MFISAYLTEFISFAPQPYQASLYGVRFGVDWVYFGIFSFLFFGNSPLFQERLDSLRTDDGRTLRQFLADEAAKPLEER